LLEVLLSRGVQPVRVRHVRPPPPAAPPAGGGPTTPTTSVRESSRDRERPSGEAGAGNREAHAPASSRKRTGAPAGGRARRSLLRLRDDAQVGLERLPAGGKLLLRLLVGHGGRDDDVLARLPVNRRGDRVLRRQLAGV